MKNKFSIIDIKNSYNSTKSATEKTNDFFMHLIYRPISFYLTFFFLKFNISANTISFINLLIAILILVVSILQWSFSYLYVAVLASIYLILDCVDGNIARITQKVSPLGQYLDSLIGKFFWVSLYASTGLLTLSEDKSFMNKWGVAIGLLAGMLLIFARESRAYVKFNFPLYFPKHFLNKISYLNIIISSVELAPFMIVTLGYIRHIDLLLIYFFIHSFLLFIGTQKIIILKLRNMK